MSASQASTGAPAFATDKKRRAYNKPTPLIFHRDGTSTTKRIDHHDQIAYTTPMRHKHKDKQRSPTDSRRIVIGLHSAREALKVHPKAVSEIWVKEGAERSKDLSIFLDFAKKSRVKLFIQKEGALDRIATSHQGVCVFMTHTPELDLDSIAGPEGAPVILVALDEVSDPHNVGAALRTAWLLGAKGILVPENRSAHLTPAAIKVASGGAEHIPLHISGNLADDLTYLKERGFWTYGLSADAKGSLFQTRFNEKVVLVVGAEDKGLRSTTVNVCDELVSIPQTEMGASLNASVAVALALYEVVRQHRSP